MKHAERAIVYIMLIIVGMMLWDSLTPSSAPAVEWKPTTVAPAVESVPTGSPFIGKLSNDGFNGGFGTTTNTVDDLISVARVIDGQEYLSHFHKRLMFALATEIVFTGDSTTAGGGATSATNFPHALYSTSLRAVGIQGAVTFNAGHGGQPSTSWSSAARGNYIAVDMAAHPNMDLYVMRWGLNDGVINNATVQQYVDSIEAGLIRLRQWKDVSALSLVLMSPNSAQYAAASPYPRNPQLFEAAIPKLKALARKYQCVWVDTWHNLLDSVNSADWQDVPNHTHPQDVMNLWINSLLVQATLPKTLTDKYGTSALLNISGAYGEKKLASDAGSTYPYGISMFRVFGVADGWPLDGFVLTFRHASNIIEQHNISYTATGSDIATRVEGYGAWKPWKYSLRAAQYTPTVAGATTAGVQTYSTQLCYVAVNGGVAHIHGNVQWATKGGTITGNVTFPISSLDLTSASFTSGTQTLSVNDWSGITLTAGYSQLGIVLNSGVLTLREFGSNQPHKAVDATQMAATGVIMFGGDLLLNIFN